MNDIVAAAGEYQIAAAGHRRAVSACTEADEIGVARTAH
jgi:hypothetical protein